MSRRQKIAAIIGILGILSGGAAITAASAGASVTASAPHTYFHE